MSRGFKWICIALHKCPKWLAQWDKGYYIIYKKKPIIYTVQQYRLFFNVFKVKHNIFW